MNSEDRRNRIIKLLQESREPLSGTAIAHELNVSRQIIVQDIALIRASGKNIMSTNRGYILEESAKCSRVFKVCHTDEETEEELNLFVDFGGIVEDVFVYHKTYNVLRAELGLKTRMDVKRYMENISSGKSSLLKNVTSGYHYHTISADSVEILDEIQKELAERGFLAKLQDYEPVNFWEN